MHGSVQDAADQQRSLHRIGRLPGTDQVLNRVRQGLEQVAILPGTDIIMQGREVWINLEPAGEVPTRAAGTDLEDDGTEPMPVVQEDALGLGGRLAERRLYVVEGV